jgi:hypothetical protein
MRSEGSRRLAAALLASLALSCDVAFHFAADSGIDAALGVPLESGTVESGCTPDCGTNACALPTSACSGSCVNLAVDHNHCGTCARACVMTEHCSAGACITGKGDGG